MIITIVLIPSKDLHLQLTALFSDLSSCQLVQVPDAIFHLMRETPLTTCNLASNIITKIPPKLAMSFTLITGERFADPCELRLMATDMF